MRPKNSEKKLVKSQFYYYRFLSLVIAVYLRLVLLYIHSSRKIKILKLTKVLLCVTALAENGRCGRRRAHVTLT
jgi:hypothetical protein